VRFSTRFDNYSRVTTLTQYLIFSTKEVSLSANRRLGGRANTVVGVKGPLAAADIGVAGGDLMNLKQAAADLGVHYMTVYRYVRQGRLAAERSGTEWRVSRRALESFKASPPRVVTAGDSRPGRIQWSSRLELCLLAGDETSAWSVIEHALAAGRSPTDCYLEVIAGALSSIGDRWARDELEIADQFLAAAVAIRIVSRLGARFRRPGRSRGTVVFGAPPGELHSLPIAIVSDLVRLRGFDVLELGANVPASAFASAVARTPRLICVGIGVTQPEHLRAVQDVVDEVRAVDREIPIIVGGLAVSEFEKVILHGVAAVTDDGRAAVAIIESFTSSGGLHQAV
jgi:MerR family transcriptional regulator, light-induced transcriptional regulator